MKAYKSEEELQNDSPLTPRGKESGRCLIHYLFNVGVIQTIDYEQSLILNKTSTWNNLSIIRSLFKKPKNDSFNNGGKLNFYLTETDEETQILERGEYCLW